MTARVEDREPNLRRGAMPSQDDTAGERPSDADAPPPWCDSVARSLLHIGLPPQLSPTAPASPVALSVLDPMASQLVRKAGVGASSVHLQFGAGKLDGGSCWYRLGLMVSMFGSRPPVGVNGAAGAISARLARRGLRVSQIVVD